MDSLPGNPSPSQTRKRSRTGLAVLALFGCCGLSLLARGARRSDPAPTEPGPAAVATTRAFDTAPQAAAPPASATVPVAVLPTEPTIAPAGDVGDDEVGISPTPESSAAGGSAASTAPVGSFAAYAEAIVPLVQEALRAAERDGAVLEAAENDPEALCSPGGKPHPDLASDALLMADIRARLGAVEPPPSAATVVHEPLLQSVRLWGEALDDLNGACGMDEPLRQGLQRIGAVAKMGGAILSFQSARGGFERLLVAEGLDALADALRGGR